MIVDQIKVSPAISDGSSRKSRRRGMVVTLSFVIVLSAGVVLAQVLQQPQQPKAPPVAVAEMVGPPAPLKLDTVIVQRGDIQQTVDAAGKLQLYKYADANAQVAGQTADAPFVELGCRESGFVCKHGGAFNALNRGTGIKPSRSAYGHGPIDNHWPSKTVYC